MFRILILGLALFSIRAFAAGQIVNCALLNDGEILEIIKVLPPPELRAMAARCADQRDMFSLIAEQQMDNYERRRYLNYARRAGVVSEQFLEAAGFAFAAF